MIEMITHTPIYVWILLAYLFWGGWKATKTYTVAWKTLIAMPAVMFVWSLYSIAANYGMISLCFWALSVSLGMWLGTLIVRGLKMEFDKERKLIKINGHWTPMFLSLSIFALRYFLGATYGFHPELKGDSSLLVVENIATFVSGMLMGRLIGYWQRYKRMFEN